MKRLLVLGLAIAAITAGVATVQAAIWQVSIEGYSFNPAALTIAAGDSVVWTNNSSYTHTVTRGSNCVWDGDFDSGPLAPGGVWGYAFDESDAGTKDYFCQYHCGMGMTGSITVTVPTPTEQSSWGKIKSLYQ